MAHGLVAQLGGALAISSQLGVGTSVELWLPVTKEAAAARAEANARAARLEPAIGAALLVDDEELVRAAMAFTLRDLGYKVTEAASAEEALELMERGFAPGLLVTDHLMPGMSGTELVRLVKARRPDLHALLISGYANVAGVAPDLPRLAKPFRGSELAAAISRLTGRVTP